MLLERRLHVEGGGCRRKAILEIVLGTRLGALKSKFL